MVVGPSKFLSFRPLNPTKLMMISIFFFLFFENSSFTLYLRLFIVMGTTWSMEGISFVISEDSKFFILTDMMNSCQGILIFVLFVLKRRVLRLIKKRFVYISTTTQATTKCWRKKIVHMVHFTRQKSTKFSKSSIYYEFGVELFFHFDTWHWYSFWPLEIWYFSGQFGTLVHVQMNSTNEH